MTRYAPSALTLAGAEVIPVVHGSLRATRFRQRVERRLRTWGLDASQAAAAADWVVADWGPEDEAECGRC